MDIETQTRLRQKHFEETGSVATKSRFALFSQPPPLAVGDDSFDRRKIIPRDENGRPITKRPNPNAMALKQGKDNTVYFSVPGYTTVGDQYIDPDRKDRLYELQKKQLQTNESQFKPASGYKVLTTSSYPYMPQSIHIEKNYKDENGNIRTKPSNPLVGIRGLHESLYQFPQFMPDEYNRKWDFERQERMKHHEKLGEKAPFRTTEFGNKAFSTDFQTYGLDREMPPPRPAKGPNYSIVKHEAPFRPSNPSKKGHNGYLQKFPEYKPDPIREIKRIDKVADREIFKPNNGGNLSRPTPTITCNPINIRREMSSMSYRM